jgi:hypothetical protein
LLVQRLLPEVEVRESLLRMLPGEAADHFCRHHRRLLPRARLLRILQPEERAADRCRHRRLLQPNVTLLRMLPRVRLLRVLRML